MQMKSSIFEFRDYKKLLLDRIKAMPKEGRGQMLKISKHLRVHPSLLSQILKGEKDLTQEQALSFTGYLGFTPAETEYFMTLVLEARSGTQELKKFYSESLKKLRRDSESLDSRLEDNTTLPDAIQTRFYSQWYYSAIRLLTSIPGYQNIDSIAERLRLPRKTVSEAISFLLESGLCVEERGSIKLGPQSTHIKSSSPLSLMHHMNWRLQCIQQLPFTEKTDLLFTSPASVSKKDFKRIREFLLDAIESCATIVKDSPAEELALLNIDWIVFRG
jgi:uncharacterized protein (TIGR02147 family)